MIIFNLIKIVQLIIISDILIQSSASSISSYDVSLTEFAFMITYCPPFVISSAFTWSSSLKSWLFDGEASLNYENPFFWL